MSNLAINTAALANVSIHFSPVAKLAVGLENGEGKEEVFAPIEEAPTMGALGDKEPEQVDDGSQEQGDSDSAQQKSDADKQQQEADRDIIRQLASRDREVRAHEQAHAAVGGQYSGSPSYTFEKGPDGVNYAVGGEVSIAAPPSGDPEVTLRAAEQIQRAALAPANPSPQDVRVAASAAQTAVNARAEIVQAKSQQRLEQAEQAKSAQLQRVEERADTAQQAEQDQAYLDRQEARKVSARRSAQLGEQLVTNDQLEVRNSVGGVFNQLA